MDDDSGDLGGFAAAIIFGTPDLVPTQSGISGDGKFFWDGRRWAPIEDLKLVPRPAIEDPELVPRPAEDKELWRHQVMALANQLNDTRLPGWILWLVPVLILAAVGAFAWWRFHS